MEIIAIPIIMILIIISIIVYVPKVYNGHKSSTRPLSCVVFISGKEDVLTLQYSPSNKAFNFISKRNIIIISDLFENEESARNKLNLLKENGEIERFYIEC